MSTVIEAALEHVTVVEEDETLDEQIKTLNLVAASLLSVERHSRGELDEQIATLHARKLALDVGLPMLDKVVFTWRSGSHVLRKAHRAFRIPLPTLGLIAIDDYHAQMTFEIDSWGHIASSIPDCVADQYVDVGQALVDAKRKIDKKITMISGYSGLLPNTTREAIRSHDRTFSKVYLVNEAEWSFETAPHPRIIDPLVVGEKHGCFFLIDVFDPSSVEDYVAREFTT